LSPESEDNQGLGGDGRGDALLRRPNVSLAASTIPAPFLGGAWPPALRVRPNLPTWCDSETATRRRHWDHFMAKHSRYQQNVIKNYYRNREAISLQRLQEMVTDLYLAEGKKRIQQWKRVAAHLEKLGLKPTRIQHLVDADDPSVIAKIVEELMAKQ
jgi:hypothetical protein